MSLMSTFLGLIGCDPNAWEEERKRLQPENFDKVKIGMLEMEVVQILGKPHHTVTFDLKPQELNYQWRWRDSQSKAMFFWVVFDLDKAVIRTETMRDMLDPSNAS